MLTKLSKSTETLDARLLQRRGFINQQTPNPNLFFSFYELGRITSMPSRMVTRTDETR